MRCNETAHTQPVYDPDASEARVWARSLFPSPVYVLAQGTAPLHGTQYSVWWDLKWAEEWNAAKSHMRQHCARAPPLPSMAAASIF